MKQCDSSMHGNTLASVSSLPGVLEVSAAKGKVDMKAAAASKVTSTSCMAETRKDSALTSGFSHLNWTPGLLLWAFPTLSHCLCHDSWHCCGLCHPADELWTCFGARGSQQEAGPPALVGALVPTHPQR